MTERFLHLLDMETLSKFVCKFNYIKLILTLSSSTLVSKKAGFAFWYLNPRLVNDVELPVSEALLLL